MTHKTLTLRHIHTHKIDHNTTLQLLHITYRKIQSCITHHPCSLYSTKFAITMPPPTATAAVAVGMGPREEIGCWQIGHLDALDAHFRHIAIWPQGRRHVSRVLAKQTTHSLLLSMHVPMGMAIAEIS